MVAVQRKRKHKTKNKSVNPDKKLGTKRGNGLLNKIIDKLPFELHVPSYQYCGPGDCE